MSYRLRLIVTISLLVAVSFSIGGTMLISASFQTALDGETDAALDAFQSVLGTLNLLNSLGAKADHAGLRSVLQNMEEQRVGRWQALTLVSGEKTIFASSSQALAGCDLPATGGGQCSYVRVHDAAGHGLVVCSALTAGRETLVLTARFDLSPAYRNREAQQERFGTVYFVVVLGGVAIAVVLSFALTRRLHKLTAAVRQISGGDLGTRSRLDSRDEFGQLSRDFDAMADKLQENIGRLESEIERQDSFLGAFAHEMKTPMTSIIGFADLLRQGNLDESTRMMAADYIYSEGHRLENLSHKLLELLLLKKDSLVMKRVSLTAFVGEVNQALSPNLKKKNIRLVCKAEPKKAVFEPDLVKSLVYNLVDNAGKAMDEGGMIAVVAAAIPGGCRFQVVDNGQGMPESELSRITEAFYRVDKSRSRKQGGAGLGLALCKQIVELHNGTIRFESVLGKGTRVTVELYGKGERK